ncbi:MAG: hypothetical protein AUK63_311 [bacterium P3]|nr:MAG: hypothetical protein AUK63_311 [bacterium P3]KWW42729.1 MAG: hypothetical protein F083_133 [bacterium F083]
MDRKSFEQGKAYAGERQTSTKRCCPSHDYTDRRMYMVTLVTEGRRKMFGEVQGRSDAAKGSAETPRMVLSEVGEAVQRCWQEIPQYYPEVSLLALQMMPDHLHGILFVRQKMKNHLGVVLKGFKTGCNKEYRRITGDVATVLQHPQQEFEQQNNIQQEPTQQKNIQQERAEQKKTQQKKETELVRQENAQHSQQQQGCQRHTGHEKGLFFEQGYNDCILLQNGQLQRWLDYMEDNPRRLLAKREHPDLFCVNFGLQYGGQTYAAIGNRFLLQHPYKLQVQCSRKLTANEIQETVERYVGEARQGAVLVSPALSPGEKAVMRAAFDAQLSTIYLSPTGFSPFTKPGGAFTEACARGHFLILAPWSERTDTQPIKRGECLMLNDMAREIAGFDF